MTQTTAFGGKTAKFSSFKQSKPQQRKRNRRFMCAKGTKTNSKNTVIVSSVHGCTRKTTNVYEYKIHTNNEVEFCQLTHRKW